MQESNSFFSQIVNQIAEMLKPSYVVFVHPDDAKTIKDVLSGMEEFEVQETEYTPKGKVVTIPRSELGIPPIPCKYQDFRHMVRMGEKNGFY